MRSASRVEARRAPTAPTSTPTEPEGIASRFERAYLKRGPRGVSWFEAQSTTSLELIERAGADPSATLLDAGGGTSSLALSLRERGFCDLVVADLSTTALDALRTSWGGSQGLRTLALDVYASPVLEDLGTWHDRACLHFVTDPHARVRAIEVIASSLRPGGVLVLGGFAQDGPAHCSGLEVARRSPEQLCEEVEAHFEPLETLCTEHTTSWGDVQRFAWIAARLDSSHAGLREQRDPARGVSQRP